jgi:RNA polymerase sigma factor (sigma-70 family)
LNEQDYFLAGPDDEGWHLPRDPRYGKTDHDYGTDVFSLNGHPLSEEFVASESVAGLSGWDGAADEAFSSAEERHEVEATQNEAARRRFRQMRRSVRDALPLLTPKQRFVIELRYGYRKGCDGETYSQDEVAECMGITSQAVQKLEEAGKTKLAACLNPRECVVCGMPLIGKRADADTCSNACRKRKSAQITVV